MELQVVYKDWGEELTVDMKRNAGPPYHDWCRHNYLMFIPDSDASGVS